MSGAGDAYVCEPTGYEGLLEAFGLARSSGRRAVLRGAGRSYGDAAIGAEQIVIDFCRWNRMRSWDASAGVLEAEPGVTIEDIWRLTLPDGWWPPVVSGTMYPTIAGALSMNIHGKNNFRVGTLGEHVEQIEFVLPDGQIRRLRPTDVDYPIVVGGAGQFGAITGVRLRLKRVASGDLFVTARRCKNFDEQFRAFEESEAASDYMVSWVDCFGAGRSEGRGLFHSARHEDAPGPASLLASHQDLPSRMLGLFPKGQAWRGLKVLNRDAGVRALNAAKYFVASAARSDRPYGQSLVAFSFLLDYIPNWRLAYLPGGFIQYQCFVPRNSAHDCFRRLIGAQHRARIFSYLGVMKRHRPDGFLFSHGLDGYSLAMDFKVAPGSRGRLVDLCHGMNDIVLEAGGKFYFAKDSTLRPSDVRAYLGNEAMLIAREAKARFDPENLLTSALAERVRLFGA